MRNLPNDARFLDKALAPLAFGELWREKLDGDVASDHRIERAHDFACGTCTDGAHNLIAAYLHGQRPSLRTKLVLAHYDRLIVRTRKWRTGSNVFSTKVLS